jgi:hypothetical protein
MSFFKFTKSGNRRLEQGLPEGVVTSGKEEEEVRKGCRRVM